MKKLAWATAIALPLILGSAVLIWQLAGSERADLAALDAETTDPVPLTWRGAWSAEAKFVSGQVVAHKRLSVCRPASQHGHRSDLR